jgi:2-polyprenyl-3-methyl-5-hydroxy-6-metoxy-1,4-benzoquinol methylase
MVKAFRERGHISGLQSQRMDDSDRLRLEVEEADRRYNEALTAVDHAFIPADETPGPGVPRPDAVLPPPAGPHRPWLRVIHRWLAPVFARQRTFDNHVVEAIDALTDTEDEVALARFQTALIIFLQKITAFVESKDRIVAATAAARLDRHEELLNQLPDIQTQLAVLQRATQMLTRSVGSRQSPVDSRQPAVDSRQSEPSALSPQPSLDYQYVAFEDRFRGSDDEIREKLRAYVPLFAGAADVLDIGCGRGEFLALLKTAGVGARGVDTNREMVATACERGLEAVQGDALAYLESLPDGSLGGLMAAQVVEHLTPPYLSRLLATAFQKLRSGAPLVVETINPACWLAFFSSYIRDVTHAQPVHPETLQYLLQANGFGKVTLRYSQPVPEHMKMQPVDVTAIAAAGGEHAAAVAQMARTVNANAAILNNLLFTHFDYAAIGYRS